MQLSISYDISQFVLKCFHNTLFLLSLQLRFCEINYEYDMGYT